MLTLLLKKKKIVVLRSGMDYERDICVGVVCPMTVFLLMLCEDVCVSFSFEASKFQYMPPARQLRNIYIEIFFCVFHCETYTKYVPRIVFCWLNWPSIVTLAISFFFLHSDTECDYILYAPSGGYSFIFFEKIVQNLFDHDLSLDQFK